MASSQSSADKQKNAADEQESAAKKQLSAATKLTEVLSGLRGVSGFGEAKSRLGAAFASIDESSLSGGSGKGGVGTAKGGFGKLVQSLVTEGAKGSKKGDFLHTLASGTSIGGVQLGGIKGVGGVTGGLLQAGMGIGQAASSPFTNKTAPGAVAQGLAGAGNTLSGAGNALISTGNPYAAAAGAALKAAGAVTKFAGAVIGSIDKLRDFSKELYNADIKFAEFSGSMTAVKEIKEVRDMLREMGQGERRAGATGQLAEAMSDFEDFMAPIEDDLAIIKDLLVAKVLPLVKLGLQYVVPVFQPWLTLLKKILGGEESSNQGEFTTAAAYVLEEATKALDEQIRDSRPKGHR